LTATATWTGTSPFDGHSIFVSCRVVRFIRDPWKSSKSVVPVHVAVAVDDHVNAHVNAHVGYFDGSP
jgi:hypothetical protein